MSQNELLHPSSIEVFHVSNGSIEIPKACISYKEWQGVKFEHSFGGKPFIDMDGFPVFAELAIMKNFQQLGYTAYWLETYARGKNMPMFLLDWQDKPYKEQENCSINQQPILDMLAGIAFLNNQTYAGCWDVLAWKDDNILFVESKRHKRDRVRSSQNAWLEAGLKYGLTAKNFMIVQWDFDA